MSNKNYEKTLFCILFFLPSNKIVAKLSPPLKKLAVLPLSQIIRISRNLVESKIFMFDQNYKNNYKEL